MMSFVPQMTFAQDIQRPAVEQDMNAVSIQVIRESCIKVKNAEKKVLYVFNLAGGCELAIQIDSNEKTISLDALPKGIYIVRVGKVARKVTLSK